MRKCVPCASDRMITALAVIVCAAAAILAFRQLLCGEQPPAVFLSARILFYDDEKIIFALSCRDRREFLWDELRNAQENAKIRIFCQSFPEAWYFYFPDKKKIRQLAAIPRMEGYDGLASMLRKKEIPAGKTTGRSAASEKEWLGQIYHEIYGEHLDKDDRGKR